MFELQWICFMLRNCIIVSGIHCGFEEIGKEMYWDFLGVFACADLVFTQKCMHCLMAWVLPPIASVVQIGTMWL